MSVTFSGLFVLQTFQETPLTKFTFPRSPSFMFIISLLLFLGFLKFMFFLQVPQISYFTSCILWYFDFVQVTKRNQLPLVEQIATQMEQCLKKFGAKFKLLYIRQQPPGGVLRKRCSENMQQMYRRTPMPKYDFNKVAKQLY